MKKLFKKVNSIKFKHNKTKTVQSIYKNLNFICFHNIKFIKRSNF